MNEARAYIGKIVKIYKPNVLFAVTNSRKKARSTRVTNSFGTITC